MIIREKYGMPLAPRYGLTRNLLTPKIRYIKKNNQKMTYRTIMERSYH
jgi:hypothetical protein